MVALTAPETALERGKDIATVEKRDVKFAPLLETKKSPPLPKELEKIAWCESRHRQFDEYGRPLRGSNNHDIGKFQINTKYWGEEAKKLGHDLMTEEGNEAMALELYQRYHTEPWKWSRGCWG